VQFPGVPEKLLLPSLGGNDLILLLSALANQPEENVPSMQEPQAASQVGVERKDGTVFPQLLELLLF
jgi:hypothetical protein